MPCLDWPLSSARVKVNIGLRVLTRPLPAKLPEIYRTLGTDYAERVLPSIIQVLMLSTGCVSPALALFISNACIFCCSIALSPAGDIEEWDSAVQRQSAAHHARGNE